MIVCIHAGLATSQSKTSHSSHLHTPRTPLIVSHVQYIVTHNTNTLSHTHTATSVSSVVSSLESTIATFAIYGCPPRRTPTTARTVVSAASVAAATFVTATTVACASTHCCLTITIARLANTCPTVLFVKKISFRPAAPVTKCPAATPFIGTASANSPPLTHAVRYAKRRPRRTNKWPRPGPPWPWVLHSNRSHRKWRVL